MNNNISTNIQSDESLEPYVGAVKVKIKSKTGQEHFSDIAAGYIRYNSDGIFDFVVNPDFSNEDTTTTGYIKSLDNNWRDIQLITQRAIGIRNIIGQNIKPQVDNVRTIGKFTIATCDESSLEAIRSDVLYYSNGNCDLISMEEYIASSPPKADIICGTTITSALSNKDIPHP